VRARLVACCLGLLPWGGAGCDRVAPLPNLVLVVIDTLRADHLGAYGYERPTSPRIDQLAERALVFTRALAPASWTRPSVGSLFTGLHPSEHGAVSFAGSLARDVPTLAEGLRTAGYATIGVSGNFVHVNEGSGFARGFDHFVAPRRPASEAEALWTEAKSPVRPLRGDEINDTVLQLLAAREDRPIFLYVHYMEPHSPYAPGEAARRRLATDPGAWDLAPVATNDAIVELARLRPALPADARRRLVDLYDAEIAEADAAVGFLVERLLEDVLGRDTVVVVVSDHGEEFGEHGGWFHGLTLHRESLAVPLLIFDARRPRAERIDAPVDLLDVPVTLLDLAGVAPPPGVRGRPLLAAAALPERDLVAELHADPPFEEHVAARWHRLAVTRWPQRVLLRPDGHPILCHLERDPGEAACVSGATDAAGPFASVLQRALELFPGAQAPGRAGAEPLDPQQLEGLRALGYAE
jgi:arylsulfatase A-like enzyme